MQTRDFLVIQWLRVHLPMRGGVHPWFVKITICLMAKNQNIKQRQYCSKFNKDFKKDPHPKTNKQEQQQLEKNHTN